MSASQEVLNSIENRLRELEQEIAALQAARSELQAREKPSRARRTARGVRKPATAPAVAPGAELSEEEWVERRAAELAAQSRRAAA
ncbi:MAG TPA: hypothetical protein VFP55_04350 [Solirubrobacteraceae bacterium]|nr:hypothetical protein [Solirubrobacteraceae bacterium]